MPAQRDDAVFEQARPRLLGLAYRILGSRADAEDAVQDAWLKWRSADRAGVDNAPAWLTAVCTRRCIDLLRSAHRTRVDYVGAWLPEPIQAPAEDGPEERLALASSLQTAFLLVLERLTPRERAAYLLREIFDVPYPEVAAALGITEVACRKLVSRARAGVERSKVRRVTPLARQEQLLAAFQAAIASGEAGRLAGLLAEDVALCADGGGKVPSILNVLHGKAAVLDFILGRLRPWWGDYRWTAADLNGGRGVILRQGDAATAAVSFAYDETGAATNIYIVRNPDKLAGLNDVAGRLIT
jgi:RNA polymerase sigma factor (sigma-70 family)